MFKALGTLIQRGTAVAAHAHTGVVGNNNAILWTAVEEGTGSAVTIDLQNPGGSGSLAIVVTGEDIVVSLARTGGTITTTAAQLIAAIKADRYADALVSVQNDGASTGAAAVVDEGPTSLASGSDTVTYATIAEVNDISGPNITVGTIPTTSHDSTGGWEEFVTTLKRGGQVTFPCNFLPTNATQNHILGLLRDIKHGTLRAMKLIFTDTANTTSSFSAYVVGISPGAPVEGKLSLNVTLQISGAVTFA